MSLNQPQKHAVKKLSIACGIMFEIQKIRAAFDAVEIEELGDIEAIVKPIVAAAQKAWAEIECLIDEQKKILGMEND